MLCSQNSPPPPAKKIVGEGGAGSVLALDSSLDKQRTVEREREREGERERDREREREGGEGWMYREGCTYTQTDRDFLISGLGNINLNFRFSS